jgi:hypothetical protein
MTPSIEIQIQTQLKSFPLVTEPRDIPRIIPAGTCTAGVAGEPYANHTDFTPDTLNNLAPVSTGNAEPVLFSVYTAVRMLSGTSSPRRPGTIGLAGCIAAVRSVAV